MKGKNKNRKIVFRIIYVLGIIIFILFSIVYIDFQEDLNNAHDQLNSITTKIFKSKYGDIEYKLEGVGPTILISHGITGGIDHGMRLTNINQWGVINHHYKFLYISRFGYLKSSLPVNATPKLQAAVYKELLDYLGIDKVYIFGNSAGGTSSMWFARDYPERTKGLILHSSAVPGPIPAAMPKLIVENDFLYWASVKLIPGTLIGLLLPESISKTLTVNEKDSIITNIFMASLPISERAKGIIFDGNISNPVVNNVQFEKIKVPTLILQANDDPRELEGAKLISSRIPDNELFTFTGGHFLLGHKKEVQLKIDEFIAKQESKENDDLLKEKQDIVQQKKGAI